jgi:tetratricopeptide (TPR) repeat protein
MTVAAGGEPPLVDLLGLAIAEPARAEAWAGRIIDTESDPFALSVGHQARAIVFRDRGRLDLALPELRLALRLAARCGDPDRQADVRATLGVALAMAGRTESGLDQLGRAFASATDPVAAAKILMRRGHIRYFVLLKPQEALADLERALPRLRATDEHVWEARTLNLIGLCHLALGHAERAAAAVESAERLFVTEGQHVESVVTLHNRGRIAYCRGDLPAALRLYDEAAERYAALGEDPARAVNDQCEALLAAGLAHEAADLVIRRVAGASLPADVLAELLLNESMAELADNQPAAAVASATRARQLFRQQRRGWWELVAELTVLLARRESGTEGRLLARSAARVATGLADSGSDEAAVAWLLAGSTASAARLASAAELLERAAQYRRRPSGLVRVTGWQARALGHQLRDDSRGVLTACRCGLDALDEHRATLGSSELRALATRHGDELSALALRYAVRSGPRRLLDWSERWRATALFQPPVHPPDDDELARDLAALRDTRRRLVQARADGSPHAAKLDDDRTRLERAIRRRTHHLAGESARVERFTTDRLLAVLEGTTFVELVDVDGVLHALVVGSGRVRHVVVGDAADGEQAVAFARFALRQTARGRPADLADVGRRLEATLLGDAVRLLGGEPVVVSPTSMLHATPWSLVPALKDVPVSVAPSAALWLRARASAAPSGARVLIAGPGLESGGAELDTLALRHPDARLLRGEDATVERSLEALDGAAVAHVAAHGRFREDSPLFSSLDLDDGPLTVHDFERLRHAPHWIVLSACESGVVAPIGAGEMLGLVSAMLAMGSAGIVSSVAKVNDQATAELMLEVHAAMDDGAELGEVLLRARQAARGDRVREATAAAFLAMGV